MIADPFWTRITGLTSHARENQSCPALFVPTRISSFCLHPDIQISFTYFRIIDLDDRCDPALPSLTPDPSVLARRHSYESMSSLTWTNAYTIFHSKILREKLANATRLRMSNQQIRLAAPLHSRRHPADLETDPTPTAARCPMRAGVAPPSALDCQANSRTVA